MTNIHDILCHLTEFIKTSTYNRVSELDNMNIFDEPLVGIARADDALFNTLKNKEVVGHHHMTPREWLSEATSVISYFLPFNIRVRESNRINAELPSTEWLYGRVEGEAFNNKVREFLVVKINKLGYKTMIPCYDPRSSIIDMRSNWSERHVAYIAGLGTFNLGKNLITQRGCAGRYGSIITDMNLAPTNRPYENIYEYCNNCGACIPRCPASAITMDGKDHVPCNSFVDFTKKKYVPRYGCGKCQTAVPCETKKP